MCDAEGFVRGFVIASMLWFMPEYLCVMQKGLGAIIWLLRRCGSCQRSNCGSCLVAQQFSLWKFRRF